MVGELDDRCVTGIVQKIGCIFYFTDNHTVAFFHVLNKLFCRISAEVVRQVDGGDDFIFWRQYNVIGVDTEKPGKIVHGLKIAGIVDGNDDAVMA